MRVWKEDGLKAHVKHGPYLPASAWPFPSPTHFGRLRGVWWYQLDDDEPIQGPFDTEREARYEMAVDLDD